MRISDWSSDGCSSDLRLAQCIRPSHEHAECKLESQPAACSELWPVVDQPLSEWTPDTFAADPNRGGPSVVAERHARIAARQQGIQFEDAAGFLGMMDADEEDRKSVVSGKSVSVRVDLGGRRIIKKKTQQQQLRDETEKE